MKWQKIGLVSLLFITLWFVGQTVTIVNADNSQTNILETQSLSGEVETAPDENDFVAAKNSESQTNGTTYQIFLPAVSKAQCQHFIYPSTTVVDGRGNYAVVQPGDVVCLTAGVRDGLKLRNFQGTAEKPIIFRNYWGQVVFDSTKWYGMIFENSQHFHVDGTGSDDQYGFKIVNSTTHGLRIGWKSEYFEVNNVEISGVPKVGVMINTKSTCSNGHDNDFDYDGDGNKAYDSSDVVNRNNFVQRDIKIHDTYVHNVGTEGFYVGSSFYDSGQSENCGNGSETVFDPLLDGVEIYNNLVENTGWDGIQVGSAISNCQIHSNQIYRDSQANKASQQSGIMNNSGSVCDIYNNFIKDSASAGIVLQAAGGNDVYNNIVVDSGRMEKKYAVVVTRSSTGGDVSILNNTLVNPSDGGIIYRNESGTGHIIENNFIVNPVGEPVKIDTSASVVEQNNVLADSIDEAGFIDPNSNNFALQGGSPALDAGIAQSIGVDYFGLARPQGAGFDAGATEQ